MEFVWHKLPWVEKVGKLGGSFPGNFGIWRELHYFVHGNADTIVEHFTPFLGNKSFSSPDRLQWLLDALYQFAVCDFYHLIFPWSFSAPIVLEKLKSWFGLCSTSRGRMMFFFTSVVLLKWLERGTILWQRLKLSWWIPTTSIISKLCSFSCFRFFKLPNLICKE